MPSKWLSSAALCAIFAFTCVPSPAQQPEVLPLPKVVPAGQQPAPLSVAPGGQTTPPAVTVGQPLPMLMPLVVPSTLPGVDQLRQYMFPSTFRAPGVEKSAKAYYEQILAVFSEKGFVFINAKTGTVDSAMREAWLKKWTARGSELGKDDYSAADDLGELAMEDLKERFNYFFRPVDMKKQNQMRSSSSVGIGVRIELENMEDLTSKLPKGTTQEQMEKALIVDAQHRLLLHPYPKSPAEIAGLKDGDSVVEVDGEKVSDGKHTQTDAIMLIKGKKGSTVELQIQRQEEGKTVLKKIVVTRDDFIFPVVHVTAADKDNIVVIKLDTFMADKAFEEMLEAVVEYAAKPKLNNGVPIKVILDLRNNGGGRVDHGVNIVGLFLKSGTVLAIKERNGSGIRTTRWTATPDAMVYTYPAPAAPEQMIAVKLQKRMLALPEDVPLVVLVNHNSWSCSELVSRSLQVNGRAKVCGENTGGKGVVNRPITLDPGVVGEGEREIDVGIGRFYPGDVEVDWEGVHPDRESKWLKPKKKGDDNQLEDAKKLVLEEYVRIEKEKSDAQKLREETVKRKQQEWEKELKSREEERRKAAPIKP